MIQRDEFKEGKPAKAASRPRERLSFERKLRGWSQSVLAEMIGANRKAVGQWERGETSPSPYYRQKLVEIFGKNAQELQLIPPHVGLSLVPGSLHVPIIDTEQVSDNQNDEKIVTPIPPRIWNIPQLRNPFFMGRQDVLERLHNIYILDNGKTLNIQALSGLGGMGKTQTALEYAYQYGNDYQAVLWAKAESREILTSEFVIIAGLLNLVERDEPNQSHVINAVKGWLQEHMHWILILDNVEDLDMVTEFIPPAGRGHILLTTCTQALGTIAQSIGLEKMKLEDGVLFLLRRTKIIGRDALLDQASEVDRIKATTIVEVLDGFPLVLDQAGAYIEGTACGLAGYLNRYQKRSDTLLKQRGKVVTGHPDSVATTLSLSFMKVEQANPVAIDLLRFCAFLHPDAIPDEMISEGALELSSILQPIAADPLMLDSAIEELRKFSLVNRNAEANTLTIHRIVQTILKNEMDEATQRLWVERTVRAVNSTLPDVEFTTWKQYERYLPQLQTCVALIEQWQIESTEGARLLDVTGNYLFVRGQYKQAEPLLRRALLIREKILDAEHLDVAVSLTHLATLYLNQGKYNKVEEFYKRALDIREKALGAVHPDVAKSLDNLAIINGFYGKITQAETFFKRALDIRKKTLSANHPDVADSLTKLAILYHEDGRYTKAEQLYKQALEMNQLVLGPEHPSVIIILVNLARLYFETSNYDQTAKLVSHAYSIADKTIGIKNLNSYDLSFSPLVGLYFIQGKYIQAEQLCQQALSAAEKELGREHLLIFQMLHTLTIIYRRQGKDEEAAFSYEEALNIIQRALKIHTDVALVCFKYHLSLLRSVNLHEEALELERDIKIMKGSGVTIALKAERDLSGETNETRFS